MKNTISTPVSSADIPFQGNADHSLCSGRVPSLLRCSFEHLADASGTALMRLINITVTHYLSAVKTVFPGVANGKQTVQWTFAVSSLRQQDRMVPSLLRCSFEHLADASGTALMRLINITVTHYLSAVKTVFPGVANGKQTVKWTFAVSSLRQQDRDGAIAASMFSRTSR